MQKLIVFSLLVTTLLIMTGCSYINTDDDVEVLEMENPNAENILMLDPDADLFQLNGIIYQTDIDWVDDLSLTKDEKIGEIKAKIEKDSKFENDMSNTLPAGTEIFSVKEREDILIVESDGKTLKYYAMVEG